MWWEHRADKIGGSSCGHIVVVEDARRGAAVY